MTTTQYQQGYAAAMADIKSVLDIHFPDSDAAVQAVAQWVTDNTRSV